MICSRQGLACGCWAKQLVCYTKLNHLVHIIHIIHITPVDKLDLGCAFPDR